MLKERLIYGPLIFSVYFVYKSILLDKHTCSHRKIFEVLPFFSIMHEIVDILGRCCCETNFNRQKKVLCKYGFSVGRGKGEIQSHPLYIPFILLNFPFNLVFSK